MDDFQNFSDPFAGQDSFEKLAELRKALATGSTYGLTDQTGGAALRLESLQATLKSATFMEKSAVMWQMIPKKKAASTVEEYTAFTEPGDAQFYTEGGLPDEMDSVYARKFEIVKYLGAVGKISNPAMAVKNMQDIKAQETLARTLGLIRKLNKCTYFGDSAVNALEFPGLLKQVVDNGTTDNVIDCKGKRLRLEEINQAATTILDNYGVPSHMFCAPVAKEYYVKELIASKTYFVNNASVMNVGINPNEWTTANGSGSLITDVFLRTMDPSSPKKNQANAWIKQPGQVPTAATSDKAPATPTIGSVTTPADAAGVFETADATNYDYRITAVNAYGESTAVTETAVTVAAGDKVVLPVTEGGGSYTATGYKVYRKKAAESTYKFCFQAAYTASPQNVEDYNLYRHGTTSAFMLDFNSDQVLAYHQLLPFFAMPLAIIDDSVRWLMKLYGVLMVYNAAKIVVIKNIGETAWS